MSHSMNIMMGMMKSCRTEQSVDVKAEDHHQFDMPGKKPAKSTVSMADALAECLPPRKGDPNLTPGS